jgi:hypothetical protein
LSFQVGCRSSLSVDLLLELADDPFLGPEFSFELSDLVPLQFDEGIETANLGVAVIIGTLPRNRSVRGANRERCQEEKRSKPPNPSHPLQ